MTKEELLAKAKERYEAECKKINETPDAVFKARNDVEYNEYCDEMNISIEVKTVKEMKKKLTELRRQIGNYKMGIYYIPYLNTVCVNYHFEGVKVRFDINNKDMDAVVMELTGGNCCVVTEERKAIVCGS